MRPAHWLYAGWLLALVWSMQPVQARTAADLAALPPYCAGRYARNTNMEEYKRWEAQYGPSFLHVHHLCDAIGALNNYYKAKTEIQKKGSLGEAVGHLDYMIQHASPDFKLMPEVYWYRSQTFNLLGRMGEALADIDRAIALDPKQARFYTQAAQYLEKIGLKEQALQRISDGLRNLPTNNLLQENYKKLGGKQPFPTPLSEPEQASSVHDADKRSSGASAGIEKSAIFDFSRPLSVARGLPPIVQAGAHVFVEVREDKKNPTKVLFRIYSRIPESYARIGRIGIDLGRFEHLFVRLGVEDSVLGKYWPLKSGKGKFTHAFWLDIDPHYMAEFTIDRKEWKPYDPRALAPGSSLTLAAILAEGRRFEDVVEAMKLGLTNPSGIRFVIIASHLLGYNPGPDTIMDDGGFAIGRLRVHQGILDEEKTKTKERTAEQTASTATTPVIQNTEPTTNPPVTQAPIGTPKNPWCRFCPEQTAPSSGQSQ